MVSSCRAADSCKFDILFPRQMEVSFLPTEADPRIRACIVSPLTVKIALTGFVLSGKSKPPKPITIESLAAKVFGRDNEWEPVKPTKWI